MKDNLLETFRFMVPTRKQLPKVFIDVTYNYDVYVQGLNGIIVHKTTTRKEVISSKLIYEFMHNSLTFHDEYFIFNPPFIIKTFKRLLIN